MFKTYKKSSQTTVIHLLKQLVYLNPLSANPTKWSNILKQFVCVWLSLSLLDHFVRLGLKGLNYNPNDEQK